MSGEGAQSLQNIMGTQPSTYSQAGSQYPNYSAPPPPVASAPPPPVGQYGITPGSASYPPGYNPTQYPASAVAPGPAVSASRPNFPSNPSQGFQGSTYTQYPQYQNYQQQPSQQPGYDQQQFQSGGSYGAGTGGPRHRSGQPGQRHPQPRSSSALTTVRITGRWLYSWSFSLQCVHWYMYPALPAIDTGN